MHVAPSEALQIGEARVRAYRNAVLTGQSHASGHNVGVARVGTARDVGRGYVRHDLRVAAHLPRTEALTHVTIKIDAAVHARHPAASRPNVYRAVGRPRK